MTHRNLPPADACTPEDLDAIADLVVRDPSASYDLAGSREHIEALCRRYQALAQDLSVERECSTPLLPTIAALERDLARVTNERDAARWADETRHKACEAIIAQRDDVRATATTLERDLAQARQHLAEMTEERDDLKVRCADFMAARARLNDLAEDLLDDIASARTEVAALAATLDAERNERQAEVLQAGADRERADEAEAATEVFEATARAALAILARRTFANPVPLAELVRAVDGRIARALVREKQISAAFSDKFEQALQQLEAQQETAAANDRIGRQLGATCEAITGKTIEQVNLELDEELAAHPDVGPLHHARDQRDHQEDTTP